MAMLDGLMAEFSHAPGKTGFFLLAWFAGALLLSTLMLMPFFKRRSSGVEPTLLNYRSWSRAHRLMTWFLCFGVWVAGLMWQHHFYGALHSVYLVQGEQGERLVLLLEGFNGRDTTRCRVRTYSVATGDFVGQVSLPSRKGCGLLGTTGGSFWIASPQWGETDIVAIDGYTATPSTTLDEALDGLGEWRLPRGTFEVGSSGVPIVLRDGSKRWVTPVGTVHEAESKTPTRFEQGERVVLASTPGSPDSRVFNSRCGCKSAECGQLVASPSPDNGWRLGLRRDDAVRWERSLEEMGLGAGMPLVVFATQESCVVVGERRTGATFLTLERSTGDVSSAVRR